MRCDRDGRSNSCDDGFPTTRLPLAEVVLNGTIGNWDRSPQGLTSWPWHGQRHPEDCDGQEHWKLLNDGESARECGVLVD